MKQLDDVFVGDQESLRQIKLSTVLTLLRQNEPISRAGRPLILLELNPHAGCIIAVEIEVEYGSACTSGNMLYINLNTEVSAGIVLNRHHGEDISPGGRGWPHDHRSGWAKMRLWESALLGKLRERPGSLSPCARRRFGRETVPVEQRHPGWV